jgi:hypothetical protein
MLRVILLLLLLLLLLCACGAPAAQTTATPPAPPAEPDAPATGPGVQLHVSPPEAEVTIDDQVLGPASTLPAVIPLAPGLHALVVSHPGHRTYRVEFTVADAAETFTVSLEPIQ